MRARSENPGPAPCLHIYKGRSVFKGCGSPWLTCSASCAHLYCLLTALAGYQLGPAIVYEPKASRSRGKGWWGRVCPVGMGLGLACGGCAWQWTHACFPPMCPFLGAVLTHIPLAQAAGKRPGKLWCGAWQLESLVRVGEFSHRSGPTEKDRFVSCLLSYLGL